MSSSVAYRVLHEIEELEEIAAEWSTLWLADEHATPFQSPAWLLPWWRQFHDGQLQVMTIWKDADLIGLLPFYVYRRSPQAQRKLLLLGAGTTDYLDGVFAPECTIEFIRRGLLRLASECAWDVLHVSQLRPESKLLHAIRDASHEAAPSEPCSRFSAVRFEALPSNVRSNARYYRNRAMRRGALDFSVADTSNCVAWFEELRRLHTERWESRGEPGVLADPRVLAWHREAIPLLHRAGLLRLTVLRINGEIIAAIYSLVHHLSRPKRTQYVYLPGFSPRHADLRPGTLLLALTVDEAAREGVDSVDLLRGNEGYKELWHPSKVLTFQFDVSRGALLHSGRAEDAIAA